MRILVVTPYLPYPGVGHGGGQALWGVLRTLGGRHEVFLASLHEPGEEARLDRLAPYVRVACAVPAVESSRERQVTRLARAHSGGVVAQAADAMGSARKWAASRLGRHGRTRPDEAELVRRTLEQIERLRPDIVQVEFPYLCRLLAGRLPDGPVTVAVAHDVLMKPARRDFERQTTALGRLRAFLAYRATRSSELRAYRRYDKTYTVSGHDRALLLEECPELDVGVRPAAVIPPSVPEDVQRDPDMVLFVGALFRRENVEALRFLIHDVMPRVRARHPAAALHIAGGGASEELRRHHDGLRVIFHGHLSELGPLYGRARVAVAPLFVGGGFIVKVYEALACGLPTVASAIANEGVGAPAGRAILIGRDAEGFADNVSTLLGDDKRWRQLSDGARGFIGERYDLGRIAAALEADYEKLVARGREQPR